MEAIQELLSQSLKLRLSKFNQTTISFFWHVRFNIYKIGDGVFDKLNNEEVINAAWDAARKTFK